MNSAHSVRWAARVDLARARGIPAVSQGLREIAKADPADLDKVREEIAHKVKDQVRDNEALEPAPVVRVRVAKEAQVVRQKTKTAHSVHRWSNSIWPF
jgi:hypothetical protein